MDKNLINAQNEINEVLEKHNITYSDAYTLLSFMSYSIMDIFHKNKKEKK